MTSVSGILAVLSVKSDNNGWTKEAASKEKSWGGAHQGHITAMLREGTHQGKRQAAGGAKPWEGPRRGKGHAEGRTTPRETKEGPYLCQGRNADWQIPTSCKTLVITSKRFSFQIYRSPCIVWVKSFIYTASQPKSVEAAGKKSLKPQYICWHSKLKCLLSTLLIQFNLVYGLFGQSNTQFLPQTGQPGRKRNVLIQGVSKWTGRN